MTRVRHWADRKGNNRVTLFRSEHNPLHRAVTVKFTPEEWHLIRRTVLAEYGLMPEYVHREILGGAYEETERANTRIAHLERELDYAATGEEPEGETDGSE